MPTSESNMRMSDVMFATTVEVGKPDVIRHQLVDYSCEPAPQGYGMARNATKAVKSHGNGGK
jgi:hypothetical protein